IKQHSFPTRRSSDLSPVLRRLFRAFRENSSGRYFGSETSRKPSLTFSLVTKSTPSDWYSKPCHLGDEPLVIFVVRSSPESVFHPDRKSTRLNSSHVK